MIRFCQAIFIASLAASTLAVSSTGLSQTQTGEQPLCTPRPIEDLINPEELESLLDVGVRERGVVEFNKWNTGAGQAVTTLRPKILAAYRSKSVHESFSSYSALLIDKLEMFERYGIGRCLEIPGMPLERKARKVALINELMAFQYQIQAPAPIQCQRLNLYDSCLCELSRMPQGCNNQFAQVATRCAQIPLRDSVIRPLEQVSCRLTCSANNLVPSAPCSCSDVGEALVGTANGTCQFQEVLPNRDDEQQRGCVSDTPLTVNPIDIFPPELCHEVEGLPEELRCSKTAKLFGPINGDLSPRIRRNLAESMSKIDARLSSRQGQCASPVFRGAADRTSSTAGTTGQSATPSGPAVGPSKDQPLHLYIQLSPRQQRLVDEIDGLYPNHDLPQVPLGAQLLENFKPLTDQGAINFHNQRRLAGVFTAQDAVWNLTHAINFQAAEIEHAMAEKRLALAALKELAAKSRDFEEKKFASLWKKIGASIVVTGVSVLAKSNPVGCLAFTAAGILIPNFVEKATGPSETRDRPNDEVIIKASEKELAKVLMKGTRDLQAVGGPRISQGLAQIVYERYVHFVSLDPLIRAGTEAAGQFLRDKATVKQVLDLVGGEQKIVAGSKQMAGVVGRAAGWRVSIVFSWNDLTEYYEREELTDNPYEWAMKQQEVGIRGINKRLALQKRNLSDLVSMRAQWIDKMRVAYCTPVKYGAPYGEVKQQSPLCVSSKEAA